MKEGHLLLFLKPLVGVGGMADGEASMELKGEELNEKKKKEF